MEEHFVDGFLERYKNEDLAKNDWERICKIAFGENLGEKIIFMRKTVLEKGTAEGVKAYKEKYNLADNDISLRRIYRYTFGYKKYIGDFPDDWWELYTDESYMGNLKQRLWKFSQEIYQEINYVFETFRTMIEIALANNYDIDDSAKKLKSLYRLYSEHAAAWLADLMRKKVKVNMDDKGKFFLDSGTEHKRIYFEFICIITGNVENIFFNWNVRQYLFEFKNVRDYCYYLLFLYNVEVTLRNVLLVQGQKLSEKLGELKEKYESKLPEFLKNIEFQSEEVKRELNKRIVKMKSYIQVLENMDIYDYVEKEKKDVNGEKLDGGLYLTGDEAQKIIDAVKNKVQQQNLDNLPIIENNFN